MRRRRGVRRTARRTTRRTTRRRRRRFRRRLVVGGMVVLAVGGAAYGAVKLSQQDADKIEKHAGASVEELSEEELTNAMKELNIQSAELTAEDKTALAKEGQGAGAAPPAATPPAAAGTGSQEGYLDELERLADLRDRGIISAEDFEAKKKQLLGL